MITLQGSIQHILSNAVILDTESRSLTGSFSLPSCTTFWSTLWIHALAEKK